MLLKTYRDVILLPTFEERYNFLKIQGTVGESTFGFERYLNQKFYQSKEWRLFRSRIIARDEGCDLGIPDFPINGRVIIHHLNPILPEDIEDSSDALLDPENVICVSEVTHNAIHFGDETQLPSGPLERKPNDTCPWR